MQTLSFSYRSDDYFWICIVGKNLIKTDYYSEYNRKIADCKS